MVVALDMTICQRIIWKTSAKTYLSEGGKYLNLIQVKNYLAGWLSKQTNKGGQMRKEIKEELLTMFDFDLLFEGMSKTTEKKLVGRLHLSKGFLIKKKYILPIFHNLDLTNKEHLSKFEIKGKVKELTPFRYKDFKLIAVGDRLKLEGGWFEGTVRKTKDGIYYYKVDKNHHDNNIAQLCGVNLVLSSKESYIKLN